MHTSDIQIAYLYKAKAKDFAHLLEMWHKAFLLACLRKGKDEYLYSAILADTTLTKRSDMDLSAITLCILCTFIIPLKCHSTPCPSPTTALLDEAQAVISFAGGL